MAHRPLLAPVLMSDLHQQILDAFNEHGVQIMSPHFEGQPDKLAIVEKANWFSCTGCENKWRRKRQLTWLRTTTRASSEAGDDLLYFGGPPSPKADHGAPDRLPVAARWRKSLPASQLTRTRQSAAGLARVVLNSVFGGLSMNETPLASRRSRDANVSPRRDVMKAKNALLLVLVGLVAVWVPVAHGDGPGAGQAPESQRCRSPSPGCRRS